MLGTLNGRNGRLIAALAALAWGPVAHGCGGPPDTHHYQLVTEPHQAQRQANAVLVVEGLTADAAYDDDRIVYRQNDYRLDYYHYYRWSAPVATLVTDYLRRAYEADGYFAAVTDGVSFDSNVVLSGRVLAMEEVDGPEDQRLARVELALRLRSASTGELLWSDVVRREEPLPENTREGLARAMSKAMASIVAETGPRLVSLAQNTRASAPD